MPTWTFFGRVLPERVPVIWPNPLEGSAKSPVLDVGHEFRVAIHASQEIVDLKIEIDKPDLHTLRNVAAGHIRTITDAVGYKEALCFDVEIISAICRETKDWTVFGIEIPILAARRAPEQRGKMPTDLIIAVGANASAQMVLADFREAMRVPIGTGFFCYRAIEAMMQSMKGADIVSDNSAWQQLRDRLRIDRSAIYEVKQHADFPRHGKPSSITDAERAKAFELTDEMIRRFLEYLIRGSALSDQEFPNLVGRISVA